MSGYADYTGETHSQNSNRARIRKSLQVDREL